jgi:polyphosphate kinase
MRGRSPPRSRRPNGLGGAVGPCGARHAQARTFPISRDCHTRPADPELTPADARRARLRHAKVAVSHDPWKDCSVPPSAGFSEPEVGKEPPANGQVTQASPEVVDPIDLSDHALYVNRELSWLAFNRRVLDQAADRDRPILERVKFLAIFCANLDEFFMIRVSGLHDQLEAGVGAPGPDGRSTRQQLDHIRAWVQTDTRRASTLLSDEIVPALSREGIVVTSWADLPEASRAWGQRHFGESVFPLLTPLAVDPVHPFPFLSNLSLSLAVEVRDPVTGVLKFARVKVPESLPRFVAVGDAMARDPIATDATALGAGDADGDGDARAPVRLVPLEELIAAGVGHLFPGMVVEGCHPFRVTRDMDMEILEEEAADLLSVVDREVRRRRFGAAVRLEVSPGVPERVRRLLLEKLALDEDDLYETDGLLGLAGLFAVTRLDRPDLMDPVLVPRVPPALAAPSATSGAIFTAISAADVLLHHPYDAFSPVLDLLQSAADDPDVLAVKITLYRAGSNSETAAALIRAAEHGKEVAVAIELKARFDEENNIAWARALERAGVHVFYGSAGLKTHAKALLVVRREGRVLRRYVHLSTGNYNASTAKLYTDMGLLTCNPEFGEDASDLFNSLSGFSRKANYRQFAVAPVTLRATVLSRIEEQTRAAMSGKSAAVFAKLNSLVDPEVIRALYRASAAGVSVDLVVRGICCLRPGVPGVSDRIRVRSVVGRFLEHERVLVFGLGDDEAFFLTSADWMPRNLDRRVEVLFPVLSREVRERIRRESIEPLEKDNCRVYEMDAAGGYTRRRPERGAAEIDAQIVAAERVASGGAASGAGAAVLSSSAISRRP